MYVGHMREEDDEWEVDSEWADQQRLPSRRSVEGSSRRVDMAANVSYGSGWVPEYDDPVNVSKERSDTHRSSEYFDDSDEEEDEGGFLCYLCTPCMARTALVVFAILAVFFTGMGTGMSIRRRQQPSHSSVDGFQSQDTSQQSPPARGDPNLSPSSPANAPTPTPTKSGLFNFEYNEATISPNEEGEEIEVPPGPYSQGPYLVGVYYYPWHGNNFHNRDGYVRSQLEPAQLPALGEYDDSKSETIAQHLKWSKQANIGLWVTSWWGPNRLEDRNTRDVILPHKDLGDLKIALHYESTGRIRNGDISVAKSDIEYICNNYFDHPNYYRIDGRPVIVMYVTRVLEQKGELASAVLTMRSAASKCGQDIYIIGDHLFDDPPNASEVFAPFWYFDAVTNYDIYGAMGRPSPYAGRSAVNTYFSEQEVWRTLAIENGCRYIPSVTPGFNDRGVRLEADHPALSRKLEASMVEGSLFRYQLEKAKPLADPMVDNLLLVNSFNEWHEDTQIEPVVGTTTNLPSNLTGDVEYQGYGELYLDILREQTV